MKKIIILLTLSILTFIVLGYITYDKYQPITSLKEVKDEKKYVLVLPLNKGVKETYMESALTMLKEEFPDVNIILGEKTKLPKSCLNSKGTRYRADSILKFLDKTKPDSVYKVIGLTSSDISITRILFVNGKKRVYPDRGIFGLGRKPGTVCVVSSYRTGSIETFSKTTVHEFMHTLGVPHCEHKHCIMQDGKGSGKNMRESNHIHQHCHDLARKGF